MCRVRGTCPAGLLSVGLCRRDIVRRETPHRAYFRHARAITRWHAEIISTVSFSIPSRKRAIHFVTQQQQQQQQQQQHTHTRTVTDTRMSWFVRKILTKKKKKKTSRCISITRFNQRLRRGEWGNKWKFVLEEHRWLVADGGHALWNVFEWACVRARATSRGKYCN